MVEIPDDEPQFTYYKKIPKNKRSKIPPTDRVFATVDHTWRSVRSIATQVQLTETYCWTILSTLERDGRIERGITPHRVFFRRHPV